MKKAILFIILFSVIVLFFGSTLAWGENGDLAAGISIQVVSKDPAHQWKGRIHVIGTIRNVSQITYNPTSGRLMASLYMTDPSGNSRTNTLSSKEFKMEVKPGQTINFLTYDMDWDTSVEFGPGFVMELAADPDTPGAGDRNRANDSKKLLFTDVNSLFKSQSPGAPQKPGPPSAADRRAPYKLTLAVAYMGKTPQNYVKFSGTLKDKNNQPVTDRAVHLICTKSAPGGIDTVSHTVANLKTDKSGKYAAGVRFKEVTQNVCATSITNPPEGGTIVASSNQVKIK